MDASPAYAVSSDQSNPGTNDRRSPTKQDRPRTALEKLTFTIQYLCHIYSLEKEAAKAAQERTVDREGRPHHEALNHVIQKKYPNFLGLLKDHLKPISKYNPAQDDLVKKLACITTQQLEEQKSINRDLQQEANLLREQTKGLQTEVDVLQTTIEEFAESCKIQQQQFGTVIRKVVDLEEKMDKI
ncbi:hypothetical protein FRB90_011838 [Tulasnella sp. 427]|nr:hypothetical protein FRB90_011838 [Tulasnella sp. 427]